MKIVKIEDKRGIVELNGVKREVSLNFIDDVSKGDFVLIHAGFAIQKISEEDAEETLKLIDDLDLSTLTQP